MIWCGLVWFGVVLEGLERVWSGFGGFGWRNWDFFGPFFEFLAAFSGPWRAREGAEMVLKSGENQGPEGRKGSKKVSMKHGTWENVRIAGVYTCFRQQFRELLTRTRVNTCNSWVFGRFGAVLRGPLGRYPVAHAKSC